MNTLTVEFCGEEFVVGPDDVFSIGREGNLVVDEDNAYLHLRVVSPDTRLGRCCSSLP